MKLKPAAALFFLLVIAACNNKPAGDKTEAPKTGDSKNPDSFNAVFDSMLTAYDSLRTAFINWDTVAADKYAAALQLCLISVPYEQLHEEDAATRATSIAQNAADALQTLINIDSINNKRRFFYTASESIYHLVKTTGYDKTVIYHIKCPMAFDGNREGWWISKVNTIDNPYLGKFHPTYKSAMLECGIIEDSINNMQ
ncbi:DUF3347 domain-containing protein [Parafilimonas sp.]|uniref:DUF3347 domain-containing protein n=1 Tax=Parafilimonas sp. TaxID=1969739 RepID=UPI0039E44EA8